MKVVVISPTYNERENIGPLIEALQAQFTQMAHDMHILVVDDYSPDGTAEVVRSEQACSDRLHLIQGRKSGLGNAYIRGMRHALDVLGADVILQMDADFSHAPGDIGRLLAEIESGADFAIGSRYVSGGSVPASWGLLRRINSLCGNIAARFIAGIYGVRDCTAGFRAIRTSLLRNIDLEGLRSQGYVFQVSLLHAAARLGARIREVPVDFIDREHGESKLSFSDISEFARNVWWIRIQDSATLLKFLTVGASGVIVNLGLFTLLLHAGMNKYLASPIAIEASIIWNFLLNNYWTFRWRKTADRTRIRGVKFNLVSLLSLTMSYLTFVALSSAFPEARPQLHQLLSIVPATLVNYFLNSYWTFRQVRY